MLVSSASSKTKSVTQDFGGEAKAGIVIHRRFIEGFGPVTLHDTPTEGGANAAP